MHELKPTTPTASGPKAITDTLQGSSTMAGVYKKGPNMLGYLQPTNQPHIYSLTRPHITGSQHHTSQPHKQAGKRSESATPMVSTLQATSAPLSTTCWCIDGADSGGSSASACTMATHAPWQPLSTHASCSWPSANDRIGKNSSATAVHCASKHG